MTRPISPCWLLLLALLLSACPRELALVVTDAGGETPDAGASGHDAGARACGVPPSDAGADEDAARDAGLPLPGGDPAPYFASGLVLPENSLPCTPRSTGVPQNLCNHHGSSIAELPDGTVAIVWYHGEEEKSLDSRILWALRPPRAGDFTAPEVIFDDPERAEGNPALYVAPDGELLLFFVSIYGGGWDQSRARLIRKAPSAATWSEPVVMRDADCIMTRHRPIEVGNGELLFPVYDECRANPAFFRSSDGFRNFTFEQTDTSDFFLEHLGQIQPALVRLADGTIAAFTRDGTHTRRTKRMTSEDRGHTWEPSVETELSNPGTGIDAVRLANGHLVVVFNNSPERRFPLSAALSYDEGKTFTAIRDLNATCPTNDCSFSYPSVMQARDGSIWVSYTHSRTTIGWVQFNEKWLAEGTERSDVICAPRWKCVAGSCYAECPDDSGCRAGERCLEGVCRADCTQCCADESCDEDALCVPETIAVCDPARVMP